MNTRRLMQIEGTLWHWIRFVMRYPRMAILALILLAICGASLALTGLGINADTSNMVSSSLPHRVAQLDFEAAFPNEEDKVALIIRARTPDEADAFSERVVEVLRQRQDAITDVLAPDLDPFFQRHALLYLGSDELDATLGRISQAAPLLRRLGEAPRLDQLFEAISDAVEPLQSDEAPQAALTKAFDALSGTIEGRLQGTPQPMSWQAVFAPDSQSDGRHQRVLLLSPVLDYSRLQPARAAVGAIREAVDEALADPSYDIEIGITGSSALRSEELGSVASGIGWSFLLSLILVGVLLSLALREGILVFTALGSLIISISITAGFAAVFYEALNLVSVAFLVLLVGLGIDFAIHLALHVQEECGSGRRFRPAFYRATRYVGAALTLCAPTSAVAFFAFAPTNFTGMAQLGIVSGFGVLVAFTVAVTLLPAVFAIKPHRDSEDMGEFISHTARRTRLPQIEGFRAKAAVVTLVFGGFGLLLFPQVRFDADPMALRDRNAPSVLAFDWLFADVNSQPFNLSVLEPDLETAEATAARLEALPVVRRTLTLSSFVPDDQDEKLDLVEWASVGLLDVFESPQAAPVTPRSGLSSFERMQVALRGVEDESAKRLRAVLSDFEVAIAADASVREAVEADIFKFWPRQYRRLEALLTPDFVTLDDLPASLRERYVGTDGRQRVIIDPVYDLRNEAAREQFVDTVRAAEPRAAGSARSVLESGRVISRAMVIAVAAAFIAVSFLLLIILRDVTLVFVILFTLALAGVLTTAAAVALNVPYNFANIIVLPLLIGVGADSGIHLGMRARRGEEAHAVYETSTPRAVFFSALTTIASFGTLALSAHRGVQTMGILLTLAIGFTLICTLLVQPWLLDKIGHRSAQDLQKVA